MLSLRKVFAIAALPLIQNICALQLDVESVESIQSAASKIAHGMMTNYKGNQTGEIPGYLGEPYYWWEGGVLVDTLIQYWTLTGDESYNEIVRQSLSWQKGEDDNFMPTNWTVSMGNDDQAIWALAALSAEEANVTVDASTPSWLTLAQRVFDTQVLRWDDKSCGGGLRWQIYTFNQGYNYKNAVSTAYLFELAARLAQHTGNSTYSEWATKVFEWTTSVGYIDDSWSVFDGAHTTDNCTDINKVQFSATPAAFISGSAAMYNITSDDDQAQWKVRLDGLLNQTTDIFFMDGIAYEVACEKRMTCTLDMFAFKGQMSQRLVNTVLAAPYTAGIILPLIKSTAKAAAKACSDTSCSFSWTGKVVEGKTHKGEVSDQISALSFVQALLLGKGAGPGNVVGPGDSVPVPNGGTPTGAQSNPTTSTTGSPSPINSENAAVVFRPHMTIVGLFSAIIVLMRGQLIS